MHRALLLLIAATLLSGCIDATITPSQLHTADKLCLNNGGVKEYNITRTDQGTGVDKLHSVVCNNGAVFKRPEVIQ